MLTFNIINNKHELYISSKLKDIEPNLDFNSIDKVLLNSCCKDFQFFLEYLMHHHIKLNNRDIAYYIVSASSLEVFSFNDDDAIDDKLCIDAWTEWWYKKYMKRVKITFKDLPMCSKSNNAKFTSTELEDMKKIVRYKFIEGGEICLSNILTDNLILRVLSQYSETYEWNLQNKLSALNVILSEANRMIHTTGTLIFIKPSKNSYGLREFRNDGTINSKVY